MAPTDTYNALLARFRKPNRQSLDRQQMQSQVNNTPGVTPPAPASQRPLTADELAREQARQGEVVPLGDAKPATAAKPQSTGQGTSADLQPKPGVKTDLSPTMPGLQQEKIKGLEGVDTSPKDFKGWWREVEEMRRRAGMETEEQRAKREKKEQAERVIAAIGDGVSALAQIHAASKGAVVNQGTGTTLSEGVSKRLERLRQWRDANENKVLNMLRQRKQDELAEKKAKRDEARAQQQAKHQEAQEKYWDTLGKRWDRLDTEKERADKAKEEETKRNHDMQEQGKNDRAAASRAAANSRNKYNQSQQNARHAKTEAGKQARYNQTRADKQGKDKKISPTGGGNNKSKKKSPTAK